MTSWKRLKAYHACVGTHNRANNITDVLQTHKVDDDVMEAFEGWAVRDGQEGDDC